MSFFVSRRGPDGILYDLFFVLIDFPALIAFGAVAKEENPRVGSSLGNASYALNAIHYPY